MNTILGLDASTESCSVALQHLEQQHFLGSQQARAHAEVLLPMVDRLLSDNQLDLNRVEAIACSAGPGSFTGLRIAFGIAQGLAYGADLPLFMVDSLTVLAESASKLASLPQDTTKLCVLDARMGEVYWAVFGIDNEVVISTQLSSPELALQQLREHPTLDMPSIALGNGIPVLSSFDKNAFESLNLISQTPELFPRADALIQVAERRLRKGENPRVEQANLNYLRNSVSWNKRKRIRSVEK